MIIILLLAGLISGSVISLASKIEIFQVYIILGMLPFSYIFYIIGTNASLVFSSSILLYIFILFILSKKISYSVNNNIILAYHNQSLINQLEKKVKEANIANKAKSDFLSIMSHEIRTPLNAIMGFVQVLLKGEDDLKKREYLTTINKSSKVLTNIINDILDITKIESGNFQLEEIEFSPKDEFNSQILLFEQNSIEKGVKLVNSISCELPNVIKSDILRIKQILSNILSNALKFTPTGKSVELIINFDEIKSSLYFEVKDEGIGISKENITNITKAFTQADSSTARNYGGTGLGLSIVTKLLNLFDSKLNIESELGVGSSFSFELKVITVDKNLEDTNTSIETNFKGKSILVAEDNMTNQMLIKLLLEDMDIDITIANDGIEAENIFKKSMFDMVLMDINMPNKNGIDAMLDIKEFSKTNNINIPIVALTANAVSGDKQKYIDKGFDDYLTKPIDNHELVKVFKKYFY
ncbi:MAG: response regulator [Sulfurimonas sp.]|nr:response regulator [Sulfurimonas sp.]